MKRILLLGMGPTALTALESLAQRFHVVGVVRSLADAPEDQLIAGRAAELSVPVQTDVDPASVERVIDGRTGVHGDVVGQQDPGPSVLARSRFVNVHYAALPRYRGRANVNWAIINGEPETAITVHAIHPGVDEGNILFQESVPLGPDDTVAEVYQRLNEVQRRELGATVERFLSGFAGVPQDKAESSYGCTRVDGDGEIHWSSSTRDVYALVRALAPPYPGRTRTSTPAGSPSSAPHRRPLVVASSAACPAGWWSARRRPATSTSSPETGS